MIINITQHCTLRCPHCMQNASPERNEFMDKETFHKALEFADKINSSVVNISGGEPTSHPMFFEFLEAALKSDALVVSVLSNGTFIGDRVFAEKFANMVKDEKKFRLQISSFKGLYDNYDEIHKPGLKAIRMFGERIVVCDDGNDIKMKPLGRACSGVHYEEAKKINGFPSCTNSCLILSQFKNIEEIGIGALMESNFKFCLPIVSWDGSIRLGEGEQCRVIANINESIEEINEKLIGFKPCGGCDSYKWHFQAPQTTQEKQVYNVLWPNVNENFNKQ